MILGIPLAVFVIAVILGAIQEYTRYHMKKK
ncbi:hypothetical protein LCGC14_1153080 [marine sediment metagenome]|uniref:Uncharacterized protein n=1 Tax=marine sediment metagenome TaxID=412755 RepID=A0A0F9LZT2_9ZZZZ